MLGRLMMLVVAALSLGCRERSGGSATAGSATSQSRSDGGRPVRAAGATAGLATSPVIDLLANRFRFHLHAPALIVPVASEGLRKYTQEYKQPWGDVVEIGGKRGRALPERSATLTFPSDAAGERVVAIRLHGQAAGQRVTVKVNGKAANLSADAAWQLLTAKLPVRAGENELVLSLAKRGPKGYALVHSIEIGTQAPDAGAAWPPLSPVAEVSLGSTKRMALTGAERMAIYLEVPAKSHLVVDTGAEAATKLRVTVHTVDGKAATLLAADQAAGAWTPRRIALGAHAGQLVRLELAGPGVAWANARIALEQAPIAKRPAPYKNVILFVVDALRSDRLAVYGKTRVRTPRITKAAGDGVVFLNNQAASPSSPPSHGSIQTGMIPRVHGVTGDAAKLAPGTPMISTHMADAGISAGYWGNNAFGMARLRAPGRWTEFHQPSQEGLGIDCTALVPELLKFAERESKAGKRFFISSLPYEPHVPYRYHPGISDRYYDGPWDKVVGKSVSGDQLGAISSGKLKLSDRQFAQLVGLYDGEVEYLDACFGTLIDGLAERGLADSTVVILTSDHGEGMLEHGRMGHAFGHYAELANVPLIVMAPGLVARGKQVPVVTSQLDIAPTILDLMGVKPSEKIQGQSLVPLMLREGPWVPRVMPLEYGRSYALRATRYKYIVDYSGTESLFDLETDPTEQRDLTATAAMPLRYLRDVAGFFLAHRNDWRMEAWGTFDNHSPAFVQAVRN